MRSSYRSRKEKLLVAELLTTQSSIIATANQAHRAPPPGHSWDSSSGYLES